ncbi:hypothetical protein ACIHFD_64385 [Nonomuraea sp. NPDC051941]|uniref:hypothetical protein n=1 Tax=Nonomuraea sp. NPDC051941 TaxID=3364373 RepID=UPI0037CAB38C
MTCTLPFDRLGETVAEMHRSAQDKQTIETYGIDCGFVRSGILAVATREHEVADFGPDTPGFLDRDTVRGLVQSSTYLAGRLTTDESAIVDPAWLA